MKPTVYLDQNVFDQIRRGNLDQLVNDLSKDYLVLVSNETMKEINATPKYRDEYIEILGKFEIGYLEIKLDQNNSITNEAIIVYGKFRDLYEKFVENEKESIYRGTSLRLGIKMAGGYPQLSFSELLDMDVNDFNQMIDDSVSELKSGDDSTFESVIIELENKKANFKEIIEQLKMTIKKQIPNESGFDGYKDFRSNVNIQPIVLNNITGNNILTRIWDLYKELEDVKKYEITFDMFFGICDSNGVELTSTYNKVVSIYSILNTIGYFQDKDINKENRFHGAFMDSMHVANGIFANYLISCDDRMKRKCDAIYEHLKINTQVIYKKIGV